MEYTEREICILFHFRLSFYEEVIMIKYCVISFLLLFGITIVYADASSPRGILEKKCYTCHNINIVLKAQKDKDEWEKTLDRMVDYGAKLNKEERKILIDFLTKN